MSNREYLKHKMRVAPKLIVPPQGVPASLRTQIVRFANAGQKRATGYTGGHVTPGDLVTDVAGKSAVCCSSTITAPTWIDCSETLYRINDGPLAPVDQQVLPRGFYGPKKPLCCT